jgi:hypothetical protein
MKKLITLFAVLGMVLALAPAAQAAPVTNPASFNPVPLGNYRLMFVTTATTTGSSPDLAVVYNPIAQTAGDAVFAGHTWTAVAGNSTVSARANTGAYVVGDGASYSDAIDVPIYTANGNLVAANNAALWAGAGVNQMADQLGVAPGFDNQSAWGGWLAGGDIIPAASGSNFNGPLGETVGNPTTFQTYKEPWVFGSSTAATTLPLVSLSSVIGGTPASPEVRLDGGTTGNVDENQPIGTVVGGLSTVVTDGWAATNFAFAGGTDDASFTIGGTGGTNLLTAEIFDEDVKSSYSIDVKADDGAGTATTNTFTITIGSVTEDLDRMFANAEVLSTTTLAATLEAMAGTPAYAITADEYHAALFEILNTDELHLKTAATAGQVGDEYFVEVAASGAITDSMLIKVTVVSGAPAGTVLINR